MIDATRTPRGQRAAIDMSRRAVMPMPARERMIAPRFDEAATRCYATRT